MQEKMPSYMLNERGNQRVDVERFADNHKHRHAHIYSVV